MNGLVDWLRRKQEQEQPTDRNDAAFARRLGLSGAMWCRLKSGERDPGMRVLQAALAAFPGERDAILSHVSGFPQGNEALQPVEAR